MQGFGEPPAYTTRAVLVAALLCMLGGLANTFVSVLDMGRAFVPGVLSVALAFGLFLFGLVLLIRFVEARDAMSDPLPRLRQYDRHEGAAYLIGLGATLLTSMVAASWSAAPGPAAWHFLPAAITAAAALVFLGLWLRATKTTRELPGQLP